MGKEQAADFHEAISVHDTGQASQDDFYLLAIAEIRSMMTNEMMAMATPAAAAETENLAVNAAGEGAYSVALADQGDSLPHFQMGGLAHDMFDGTEGNSNASGDGNGQQFVSDPLTDSDADTTSAGILFIAAANDHHPVDSVLLHDALPEITGNGLQDMMTLTSLLENARLSSQQEPDWRHDDDNSGYSSAFSSFLSSGTSFEDHGSFGGMAFAKPLDGGGGKGGGGGGGGGGGHGGGHGGGSSGGGSTDPAIVSEYTSGGANGYNIHLIFDGVWTDSPSYAYLQQAFIYGADLLSSIVTGDVQDVFAIGYGAIDDIDIHVVLQSIDGVGNVLGSTGFIARTAYPGQPYYGQITLDVDDVGPTLTGVSSSTTTDQFIWDDVAVHEMIHALGFAQTTFQALGLIDTSDPAAPLFTGTIAESVYGGPVPLEGGGGSGTAYSHWDEATFGDETMTGWVSNTPTTLSGLTVAALYDLGYAGPYLDASGQGLTSGHNAYVDQTIDATSYFAVA